MIELTKGQIDAFKHKFTYLAGDGIRMEPKAGIWVQIISWIQTLDKVPSPVPVTGFDLWIKTGLGQGPEYMFKSQATPRKGDDIYITTAKGDKLSKEIARVVHDPENNRVIVFTH